MKRSTMFMPALVLLASCALPPDGSPEWMSRPHADHPAERYMVGVATAQDCQAAIDAAYGRLAQQVEVDVRSTEFRRYQAQTEPAREMLGYRSTVELVTDATLMGAELVGTHTLDSGGCAARVVLDLQRAVRLYADEIARLDRRITQDRGSAETAESLWERYTSTMSGLRTALRRDRLAMTRRTLVIRTGAPDAPPVDSLSADLIDRAMELRESFSCSIVPVGDVPALLLDRATAVMEDHGIPMRPGGEGSVHLRIGLSLEPAITRDPRWWQSRWRLNLSIVDGTRGGAIRSVSRTGEAYGLDKTGAIDRSHEAAADSLAEAMDTILQPPGNVAN